MNYFPFHIGDYASATRHLTWDEDMAYRRLLDWYYTNEKPLPADLTKVNRLMLATKDEQRAAVASVLEEFFVATDEGWRHSRADQELVRMREKQDANEERDDHEKTRMQKHRERRSAIFSQLAEVGVYPAWNAKTGELEKLVAENCAQPVTAPVTPITTSDVTEPVTAPVTGEISDASLLQQPATAIPTPTPTPTPTPKNKNTFSPPAGGCKRFEEFWLKWPKGDRKQDKVKCAEKWRSDNLDAVADSILADIEVKRHTEKWRDGFVEAPLVYLRGKRWEDGIEAAEQRQETFV